MPKFAIIGSRGFPSYYGGFETLVRHLAPYLVNAGHQVTVYGRQPTSLRSWSTMIDGVEVKFTAGHEGKTTSTLSFGFTSTRDAAHMKYDAALVLNVANGNFLGGLKRAGVPTVVNVDGMEWQRAKWNALAKRTFLRGARKTAEDANALIFDSRALGTVWTEKFGREGIFIPYGAPVLSNVPSDLLSAVGLLPQGYVLAVSRIVPENNVGLLLDALEYLPPNLRTVIVGDSNYSHLTLERLKDLHGTQKVVWLGHVEDQVLLNQLWAHAGIYWHGHSVGGTNPALLQALGAGAPTLALDTTFNREVVENDNQLVEPDSRKLAHRINEVLSDAKEMQSMREWGQAVVSKRYQWDFVCKDYEDVLSSLAAAPKSTIK